MQQGALRRDVETGEYKIGDERKSELERLYYDAAEELGETQSLVALDQQQALAGKAGEDDEPRLPITAARDGSTSGRVPSR